MTVPKFHTYEVKLFQKDGTDQSNELRDALAQVFKTTDTNANEVKKQSVDWKSSLSAMANAVINKVDAINGTLYATQAEAEAIGKAFKPLLFEAYRQLGYPILSTSHAVIDEGSSYKVKLDYNLDTSG